nr:ADAMTS-like protein 1 [Lytechinus pictus]
MESYNLWVKDQKATTLLYPFCSNCNLSFALSSQGDDDSWTEWSRWSECSRTCGGGASYQTRQCNTGYSCTGRNIRYKTCNTQECSGEELDFRSQQCAAYNDEKYENRTIEWEPVESSSLQEMCSLVCRVKHHNFTKMLAPKVLDGTRCNRYSVDMCIAGKCEPVGCDHEFNSTATFDRCKVCNGDNTTCQLMMPILMQKIISSGLNEGVIKNIDIQYICRTF